MTDIVELKNLDEVMTYHLNGCSLHLSNGNGISVSFRNSWGPAWDDVRRHQIETLQPVTNIDEISLILNPPTVNRKLKAIWSMDADQDLRGWCDTPARDDFVHRLTKSMADEIDREIINDLRIQAITQEEETYIATQGELLWPSLNQRKRSVSKDI